MQRCGVPALMMLVVALFVFLIAGPAVAEDFDSKEFFLGDWGLEVHRTSAASPSAAGLVETASWKIKDGNETLYGVFVDEKDEERQLRIELESTVKGQFLLAVADEESEDFVPIFAFAFTNRTAGFFVSQGEWKDEQRAETGVYQLVATSPSSLLLTLWLNDAQGVGKEVVTIAGKKFVAQPPQTFLQRFGMPIAVVGMMMVSQFLKSRGAPAAPPQQPATAARRPDEDSGAEEPRFTEITDEDEDATEATESKKEQ